MLQQPPPGTAVTRLLGLLGQAAEVGVGQAMSGQTAKTGKKKKVACTPCAAMADVDAARDRVKNGGL